MHIVRCKTKTIRKEEIKIEKEEWKIIEGYTNYAVSNFGRVKNVTTGNISNCIKGRSKTHKSFIWKLKEEKQSC